MNKGQIFSTSNLSVVRGDRIIFEGLSFEVNSGELLKLVGPNGSGKSTLLKTLAGLIEPVTGDMLINGQSVAGDHDWLSQNLRYLGHKNALKKEFTVYENIEFWARLWGHPEKITSSLKQMGIEYLNDTPVRYLSSGQTRRAALARSMCHGGSIWLYDEPTVGLDEQGLSLLADAMKNHLSAGGIILCATHVDLALDAELVKTLNLGDFTRVSTIAAEVW